MSLVIRALIIEMIADADPTKRWNNWWLEVVPRNVAIKGKRWEACVPKYHMMCEAIMSDVLSGDDGWFDWIAQIESGQEDLIEADGNAWVAYITRDKVWFEGLYNQGEGGEVSLAQYKLAVQTYARFLADPESKPIEVEFPT
jgi:hypothetical protein